jgi:quinol monooxygenase YgiN
MATILARIVIHSGREAEFEALAASLHRASHDTEEHLRAYGYWRAQEPRHYYTLLAFDDYLGFLEHQSSDHHESAAPQLRDFIESISLEWVDPIEGASTLVASNPQDVPDDASPVARRYSKLMPAQVADWWHSLRSSRATEG